MSEHTCPVMNSLLIPTVTIALTLALETPQDCDEVMKAAALRKDQLLAEASPANPYGSAKHGVYDALSAAAVAEDVEPEDEARCPECARGIATEAHQIGCPLDFLPAPTGHLPQHTHGERGCTHTGCHDAGHDLPAPTIEADAGRLAAHAPRGAL